MFGGFKGVRLDGNFVNVGHVMLLNEKVVFLEVGSRKLLVLSQEKSILGMSVFETPRS